VIQHQLLGSITKNNNNKPVLVGDQAHEISFNTSVTARISVVDVSNNMKASCALQDTWNHS
jgi:hypothetical protein